VHASHLLPLSSHRIPRYLLLLKELLKYTDSTAADPRRTIELVIDKIDKQLGRLNKNISSSGALRSSTVWFALFFFAGSHRPPFSR